MAFVLPPQKTGIIHIIHFTPKINYSVLPPAHHPHKMEFLVSILTSIQNLFYPPTPKNQNFWNNFSPEIFSTPTSCFGSQRSFLRKTNKKFASLLNLCIKLLTNNWEPCFTMVLIRQNIITLRFISLGLIYVIFSFAK